MMKKLSYEKTILVISFQGKVCGYLSNDEKQYYFQYDPKYFKSKNAKPLSPEFPLQAEAFCRRELFPFFTKIADQLDAKALKESHFDRRSDWSTLSTLCNLMEGDVILNVKRSNLEKECGPNPKKDEEIEKNVRRIKKERTRT